MTYYCLFAALLIQVDLAMVLICLSKLLKYSRSQVGSIPPHLQGYFNLHCLKCHLQTFQVPEDQMPGQLRKPVAIPVVSQAE